MIDIEPLIQAIRARLIVEVPALGGRVFDRATEGDETPYAAFDTFYAVAADAECIEAEDWTIQIGIYHSMTSKAEVGKIVGQVKAALHGWADTDALTMHPLEIDTVRVTDDPDGVSVHGIVIVRAMVESDG